MAYVRDTVRTPSSHIGGNAAFGGSGPVGSGTSASSSRPVPTQSNSSAYAAMANNVVGGLHAFGGAGETNNGLSMVKSNNAKTIKPTGGGSINYWSQPSGGGGSPVVTTSEPIVFDYLDAPYASAYGMDVSTAYQEALANTAYQRKVKDLQAAGLNPVLGVAGQGAGYFSGTPAPVTSIESTSSGGASGVGSMNSSKKTLDVSGTAKKLQYWLPSVVQGVATLAAVKTGNIGAAFSIGAAANNATYGVLGAIRNHA